MLWKLQLNKVLVQGSKGSVWAGVLFIDRTWHEEEKDLPQLVAGRHGVSFPMQTKVNICPLISYGLCQEGYLLLI